MTETCTHCVGAAAIPDACLGDGTLVAIDNPDAAAAVLGDAGRALVAIVIFLALGCACADFSMGSLPFV